MLIWKEAVLIEVRESEPCIAEVIRSEIFGAVAGDDIQCFRHKSDSAACLVIC